MNKMGRWYFTGSGVREEQVWQNEAVRDDDTLGLTHMAAGVAEKWCRWMNCATTKADRGCHQVGEGWHCSYCLSICEVESYSIYIYYCTEGIKMNPNTKK